MKRYRIKSDKGATNTISFMLIIFVVVLMLVSFIDVGLYFNVKNEIQAAAENGARNVAIYGGTQSRLRTTRTNSRGNIQTAEQAVETSIQEQFRIGGDSKMVKVSSIKCGPENSKDYSNSDYPMGASAGNAVFCTVKYEYTGLAGDFGLFKLGGQDITTVTGTAVSEVTSER